METNIKICLCTEPSQLPVNSCFYPFEVCPYLKTPCWYLFTNFECLITNLFYQILPMAAKDNT